MKRQFKTISITFSSPLPSFSFAFSFSSIDVLFFKDSEGGGGENSTQAVTLYPSRSAHVFINETNIAKCAQEFFLFNNYFVS